MIWLIAYLTAVAVILAWNYAASRLNDYQD